MPSQKARSNRETGFRNQIYTLICDTCVVRFVLSRRAGFELCGYVFYFIMPNGENARDEIAEKAEINSAIFFIFCQKALFSPHGTRRQSKRTVQFSSA